MVAPADLVLANARVLTLDPERPCAEAVAVQAGRIRAVGAWAELRSLVGPSTAVIDAAGGVAVPAFHDAHLHLLSYARTHTRLDCRAVNSLAALSGRLVAHARALPPGAWVRAWGYDEARLREGRHPDRHDLDAAVPDRPVRLQHRSLHLDVLNTAALRALGLLDGPAPLVERDAATGAPTGRLYHAAALLRERLPRPTEAELATAVRAATNRLLAWGVTSVQDASHTNGPAEWALFARLAARGALGVRVFVMPGAGRWPGGLLPLPGGEGQGKGASIQDPTLAAVTLTRAQMIRGRGRPPGSAGVLPARPAPPTPAKRPGRPCSQAEEFSWLPVSRGEARSLGQPPVLLGPIKIMLDEATSDPAAVRATVAAAHAAGHAVAIHAVSEAEVALALDALASSPRAPSSNAHCTAPDRIEHGAVIPDAWLGELRALGVMVVGQPALVAERGDVYRAAYPAEAHGWLHRAGSLLRAGIGYAAGSDAPVTEPAPGLGVYAARQRRTPDGAVLSPDERLGLTDALSAFTLGPARAVGMAHVLGRLQPGMLADLAILDPDALEPETPGAARRPARLTLSEGRVVWQRGTSAIPTP
jgi:predicted amidohydrolase YtcJ